ncbi:MAG: DUF882 domain-containing protein [Polyangiaceae bacterium]
MLLGERVLFAWAAPLCAAWFFPGLPPTLPLSTPAVHAVTHSVRHWDLPVTVSEFAEQAPSPAPAAPWAQKLDALHIEYVNTENAEADLRLYANDGTVDRAALEQFDVLVAKDGHRHTIDPRSVQLMVKAAYHFGAKGVVVISAYRPRTRHDHGPHTTGAAIDFQLPGVAARTLAAYLRKEPKAGVGIYTNPRTQFVHLDSREQSYHWLDASPPRVVWREKRLTDPNREVRDAAYVPNDDLPEHRD